MWLARTARRVPENVDWLIFDWNGGHYGYHPNVGVIRQPIPIDAATGQPFLAIALGDLVDSVIFCAEYRKAHPDEKVALVFLPRHSTPGRKYRRPGRQPRIRETGPSIFIAHFLGIFISPKTVGSSTPAISLIFRACFMPTERISGIDSSLPTKRSTAFRPIRPRFTGAGERWWIYSAPANPRDCQATLLNCRFAGPTNAPKR